MGLLVLELGSEITDKAENDIEYDEASGEEDKASGDENSEVNEESED